MRCAGTLPSETKPPPSLMTESAELKNLFGANYTPPREETLASEAIGDDSVNIFCAVNVNVNS